MIIQDTEALMPAWLTQTLYDRGALTAGAVTGVTCSDEDFRQGYVAHITRVNLTYSADAAGTLPPSLILKMMRDDLHPELRSAGRHEVEFYQAMESPTIPLIYSAEVDAADHSHILMQDLSRTHTQRPLPIPPSNRHCEQIVETLAKLHAHWWNAPALGVSLGQRYSLEQDAPVRQRLYDTYPKFADHLGDALLPAQRQMYEKILQSNMLDRLADRLIQQHNVTLVHGDVHTGNVMLPREAQHQVMLIDWHLWAINLGTLDLAFMIALHWSPARRAVLEKELVRRYYDTLIEHGVTGYSWDDCWNDYRLEVLVMMLVPIGQYRRGSPAGVVWFGLQDSSAAVMDLNCAELL